MAGFTQRRLSLSNDPPDPQIGILYHLVRGADPATGDSQYWFPYFVDVLTTNRAEVLALSDRALEPREVVYLELHCERDRSWIAYRGQVVWCAQEGKPGPAFQLGLDLHLIEQGLPISRSRGELHNPRPLAEDYAFFRKTRLLRSIPRGAFCPVLNSIFYWSVGAGERFMTQGDPGDRFFLIQRGTCRVTLEKGGEQMLVAHLREGDVVGEMAVLTGEPRNAHVDAETDMEFWGLTKDRFDVLSQDHPDLSEFLTELVAHRFAVSQATIDRTIGKYLITDIIGKGGFSIVYRGRHLDLEMPVAIKMMKHDLAMHPDFIANFRQEARTVASLHHPHIVQVYDFEERYRTLFIIMEYLEGLSLEALLQRMGRLPPDRTLRYLFQILDGLEYAHNRGLVHLDMKPANIFLSPEDRIKILDFGLACPPGSEPLCWLGTPHYASPEQIEGDTVDVRADLYSLGIMTFELLTGVKPFPGDDPAKLLEAHLTQAMPDPRDRVADLPTGMCDFIRRATQKKPEDRFSALREARQFLEAVSGEVGLWDSARPETERKMMSLFLFYRQPQRAKLNTLLDEFTRRVQEIGVQLKAADFKDID